VESLLKEHTRVCYTGQHGVHLPEGYNGLGTRNLIYILLRLLTFHKAYRPCPTLPGGNLIFIEEPEAHLYRQIQEVFIKHLDAAAATFFKDYPKGPNWPVQFYRFDPLVACGKCGELRSDTLFSHIAFGT
jgi:putative ATP-dependent endonuclease of OLD family